MMGEPNETPEADAPGTEIVPAEPTAIYNPQLDMDRAREASVPLALLIKECDLSVKISNREYVRVEGWIALLGTQHVSAIVESVEAFSLPACLEGHGICGYESRVVLIRDDDQVQVGAGVAECSFHERTWRDRDGFAVKSMAQTRALGKAARMKYGFIMRMAGFEATPEEEITPDAKNTGPPRGQRRPAAAPERPTNGSANVQPPPDEITALGHLLQFAAYHHGWQPGQVAAFVGVKVVGEIAQKMTDEGTTYQEVADAITILRETKADETTTEEASSEESDDENETTERSDSGDED